MSDSVSTIYGRADLSQDVANTIEEMGTLDYAQLLREFFPCRNITPRDYAKNNLVARRVKCVYIGLGEDIPMQCPRGWDLLVVCGVAFTRREVDELAELLERTVTGERVLLGVPLVPIATIPQLRELCALKVLSKRELYDPAMPSGIALQSRRKFVQKQLSERARKALSYGSFRWMCKGHIVEEAPVCGRNMFLSDFLRSIYNASPRITLGCSKNDFTEALDELLDLANPLQISNINRQGAAKVLRRFMVDTGICKVIDDQGAYSRYDISDYIQDSTWGAIWKFYIERLIGDGSEVKCCDLSVFTNELSRAPWGLNREVQALILAALLRRAQPDLNLENHGEPVALTARSLMRALVMPRDWQICYRPASAHEMRFLGKIREIFATDSNIASGLFINIWDCTLRAVTSWYQQLSGVAKIDLSTMSEDTRKFVELITDKDKRSTPKYLWCEYLPELCGQIGIPLDEDQASMVDWLKKRRSELEMREASYKSSLCSMLGRILVDTVPEGGASVEWLDEVYNSWAFKLHAGTFACTLDKYSAAVRSLTRCAGNPEERWFVVLPRMLDIPEIKMWDRDLAPIYKARFAKACLELETWSLKGIEPWPSDRDECEVQLAKWLTGTFNGMKLSVEQRESVLLDILEKL